MHQGDEWLVTRVLSFQWQWPHVYVLSFSNSLYSLACHTMTLNPWIQQTSDRKYSLKRILHLVVCVVVCTCNPSIWEVKAGRLGVQGQTQLLSEFKASQGYMSSCLKNNCTCIMQVQTFFLSLFPT